MEPEFASRFWAKVDRSGSCWVWTAYRTKAGYGQFGIAKRLVYAHRVAWLLEHGAWPTGCVLHRCDNPACVNPAHLFEGSRSENARDRDAKDRVRHGEAHPAARLTLADVLTIRAGGRPSVPVSERHIRKVRSGQSWRRAHG